MKLLSKIIEASRMFSNDDINNIKKYANMLDDIALIKYNEYLKNKEKREKEDKKNKKISKGNK